MNDIQYLSNDKYESLLDLGYRSIDYKKRADLVRYTKASFLNKLQAMFKWKNLPDTVIQRDMELLIQRRGAGVFIKHEGKYYVVVGNLGGRLNFNYMPSIATIANPYLGISGRWQIYYGYDLKDYESQNVLTENERDNVCVVIPNDPLHIGVLPTLDVYGNSLADTRISRRVVTIMSRAVNAFIAGDNNVYESVKKFMKKVEDGELDAIIDNDFLKEIKSLPFGASSASARMITELIEAEQYDKASLHNELGLQANYNMKREAINSDEAQLGEDAILPMADIMLEQRQIACERINKLFGLNISVDFASAWKLTRRSMEAAVENAESPEESSENSEKEESDDNGNGDSDVGSGDSGK